MVFLAPEMYWHRDGHQHEVHEVPNLSINLLKNADYPYEGCFKF